MAFPPYGEAVPSLVPYQMQFNGFQMGPGTSLELLKLEGVDLPTVRTGDAGRPRDQGMFVGLDVLAGRELIATGELNIRTPLTWEECASATLSSGTIEKPLYLSLPGFGTLATMARVRKRNMPMDIKFTLGNLASVTLLFASSDPRWYGETKQASVVPPSTTAGFSFNFSFGRSFGGGSVVGSLSIDNEGNYETRPKLIIEGPCTNPSITNATAPGAPNLTFNLSMNTGDQLIIDTDLHTATYFSSGTSIGTTRLPTLAQGSRWFVLEPGTSTLQFLAGTGEGKLTCEWASAFIV